MNKTRNKLNIFKINNKDARMSEHISHFVLLLLLLNSRYIVSDKKLIFSKCEKYIVQCTGKICWATCFHFYSLKIR